MSFQRLATAVSELDSRVKKIAVDSLVLSKVLFDETDNALRIDWLKQQTNVKIPPLVKASLEHFSKSQVISSGGKVSDLSHMLDAIIMLLSNSWSPVDAAGTAVLDVVFSSNAIFQIADKVLSFQPPSIDYVVSVDAYSTSSSIDTFGIRYHRDPVVQGERDFKVKVPTAYTIIIDTGITANYLFSGSIKVLSFSLDLFSNAGSTRVINSFSITRDSMVLTDNVSVKYSHWVPVVKNSVVTVGLVCLLQLTGNATYSMDGVNVRNTYTPINQTLRITASYSLRTFNPPPEVTAISSVAAFNLDERILQKQITSLDSRISSLEALFLYLITTLQEGIYVISLQ